MGSKDALEYRPETQTGQNRDTESQQEESTDTDGQPRRHRGPERQERVPLAWKGMETEDRSETSLEPGPREQVLPLRGPW